MESIMASLAEQKTDLAQRRKEAAQGSPEMMKIVLEEEILRAKERELRDRGNPVQPGTPGRTPWGGPYPKRKKQPPRPPRQRPEPRRREQTSWGGTPGLQGSTLGTLAGLAGAMGSPGAVGPPAPTPFDMPIDELTRPGGRLTPEQIRDPETFKGRPYQPGPPEYGFDMPVTPGESPPVYGRPFLPGPPPDDWNPPVVSPGPSGAVGPPRSGAIGVGGWPIGSQTPGILTGGNVAEMGDPAGSVAPPGTYVTGEGSGVAGTPAPEGPPETQAPYKPSPAWNLTGTPDFPQFTQDLPPTPPPQPTALRGLRDRALRALDPRRVMEAPERARRGLGRGVDLVGRGLGNIGERVRSVGEMLGGGGSPPSPEDPATPDTVDRWPEWTPRPRPRPEWGRGPGGPGRTEGSEWTPYGGAMNTPMPPGLSTPNVVPTGIAPPSSPQSNLARTASIAQPNRPRLRAGQWPTMT